MQVLVSLRIRGICTWPVSCRLLSILVYYFCLGMALEEMEMEMEMEMKTTTRLQMVI